MVPGEVLSSLGCSELRRSVETKTPVDPLKRLLEDPDDSYESPFKSCQVNTNFVEDGFETVRALHPCS